MDSLFSVGDRVRCVINHPDGNKDIVVGSTGTIVCMRSRIGVRWDDEIAAGHTCTSGYTEHCELRHGWFVDKDYIERAVPPEETETMVVDMDEWKDLIYL